MRKVIARQGRRDLPELPLYSFFSFEGHIQCMLTGSMSMMVWTPSGSFVV